VKNCYRKKSPSSYNVGGRVKIGIKLKSKKYKTLFRVFCGLFLFTFWCASAEELTQEEGTHHINFQEVPIAEFIRFVSKISHVNFIFDNSHLQFNISFSSGKSVSSDHVLQALIQLLRVHGFAVMQENGYYMVHKMEAKDPASEEMGLSTDRLLAMAGAPLPGHGKEKFQFSVFKLQYHQGSEIQEAIKKIAADLKNQASTPQKLLDAIHSMQWVKTTNSLLCSGDAETMESLKELVGSLDSPLRQVFIEILVIETDVRKSLDFGLQWAAGGEYNGKFGFGMGNFPPASMGSHSTFSKTLQGINATNTPTGLNQIPVGSGFDLGVIGDIIMHKGKSFLSLGSLVSALQADGDSTIVLNQKIITQDNKNSTIFVGDNIPFPGSVVQTIGSSQQTTANIEYRDIGVSLSITPMLGEGDIITLDLDQEISEALNAPSFSSANTTVNGIRSTKTNMVTHVHVPDKHFLVLSGMIRNTKTKHKAGLPCLGGLPFIGAAFSKTRKEDEKRNVIIFVRPHIIRSFEDYGKVTETQEEIFKKQGDQKDFEAGLNLMNNSLAN
jgi:type II secretory pathway component GspD/PulD (secretin)